MIITCMKKEKKINLRGKRRGKREEREEKVDNIKI